jgi:Trk K+ transport system NAD-binding subunit
MEAALNIIIVGCGKIGKMLAKQLNQENHDITIIDENNSILQKIVE